MNRTTRTAGILLLLLASITSIAATSSAAPTRDHHRAASTPNFRLVQLRDLSFQAPVWVGGAGDGRAALYVVEQRGIVWKVVNGRKLRFLDLRRVVASGGEQGLLSIAFARDFRTSGRMFAYLTRPGGIGQVRQYRVRDGRVVSGSGRVVITISLSPPAATNHNGGNLWTTSGGQLFISIGDGGGGGDPAGNAQRLDRLTGKLLRITPRLRGGYTIPRTNPYYGRSGVRREVYALGLRNPWRFSVDAPTGDIWIGDVGQGEREEIDRLRGARPAGANFGWPRMEGNHTYAAGTALTRGTPYTRPFLDYGRGGGECSVTGGVVYRGPVTALRGWYLYADYCTSRVSAIRPATKQRMTMPGARGIVHFGAGARGHVYVASQQTGRIYRVASA